MKLRRRNEWRALAAALALGGLGATSSLEAAPAAKFEIINKFVAGSPRGYAPTGELNFGTDGALYGVTQRGGKACPNGDGACGGVVYRLAPPKKGSKWAYEVLHGFQGAAAGASPRGGVTVLGDGSILGVTKYGGDVTCIEEPHRWGCGTFFQLRPPKDKGGPWKHDVFQTLEADEGPRLPDQGFTQFDGKVFGLTERGGEFDKGVLFDIAFSRAKPDDGVGPQGSPLAEGCRILWSLRGSSETEAPLTFFDVLSPRLKPEPSPPVIYNSGRYGGDDDCEDAINGCGGVSALTLPSNASGSSPSREATFKVVHAFLGGKKGSFPIAGGVVGRDGSLYGAAYAGVSCDAYKDALGCGVIYRLTPPTKPRDAWSYQIIYSFKGGADGDTPVGRMAFDDEGNLYGVTSYGGKCSEVPNGGCGTVWRLKPPLKPGRAWRHDVLRKFDGASDGKWPSSGLTRRGRALFGVTDGAVFQVKL